MFRKPISRLLAVSAVLFLAGCNSSGSRSGLCSSCNGEKPGMFSRFRTTSSSNQPMIISSGQCCDQGGMTSGPYLPAPQQGTILPSPQTTPQPQNIPRIDENGKQMPWDPKMSGRPGIKTADIRASKE